MIISHFPSGGNIIRGMPKFSYTGDYEIINDGHGNWRLRLLTSGELTFQSQFQADLFAVGGGGGGMQARYTYGPVYNGGSAVGNVSDWYCGGGGAGGRTATERHLTMIAGHAYQVTIGAGGAIGSPGGDTSMDALISAQGGRNAPESASNTGIYGTVGGSGGSGGGSGAFKRTGYYTADHQAGGGGYDGGDGTERNKGTGQGTTTREFGELNGELYGGGGAGGNHQTAEQMLGGPGGGGDGAATLTNPSSASGAGADNLGGGGGGGAINRQNNQVISASPGGRGILIIRNARE